MSFLFRLFQQSHTHKNLFIPKDISFVMAKQNTGINMPAGFGGLMRYGEEYSSYFNLKPAHIVGFIIFIVVFRIGLGVLFK